MTETIVGVVGAAFLVVFGIAYIVEMRRDSARRRRDEEEAIRRLRAATVTLPGGATMRLFVAGEVEQRGRASGEAMMRGFSRDVLAQGADFEQLARVDPPRSEQLRIGPWLEESAPVPESVFAPAVKACVAEATEAAFREVATPLEDMPVPAPCATYPDTTNMAPDPEPCRAVESVSFSAPDQPTSYDPPSGGGGDL